MSSRSSPPARGAGNLISNSRLVRVLRYRDFRLLWIGAFLSFTGSWVQNVAQGVFVYNLTNDEQKLAMVNFAWSIPVLLFGLVAGSFSDHFDKRTILTWTQVVFAVNALYLAFATYFGFVQYWQIVLISFLNGVVACIEMPTRQSIVSRVVPPEELAAAVPVNAMTFNVARIFGPALGAILLSAFGVAACYLVNGISFLALIWSARAIKADLKSTETTRGPIVDLVLEGALYTFRDHRLRALFLLEATTAMVGLAYMPLLPAYVKDTLRMEPNRGNGFAYTAVGIGALVGLIVVTQLADSKVKGTMIRFSMWTIGLGLILLAAVPVPVVSFVVLGFVGLAVIMQFNTTNALFQLMSPDRLRGRVLAMHIWALNGLSPFGVLFFGWLAHWSKHLTQTTWWMPVHGVPLSFGYAGILMTIAAVASQFVRRGLANLTPEVDPTRGEVRGSWGNP